MSIEPICHDIFKEIKTDLKEINKKVDALLEFKWKIVGGSVVASFIFSLLVAIIFNYVKVKN